MTNKERVVFIEWLEMTANTCQCMAEQMDKLSSPVMNEIIKRENIKASACLLISKELKNCQIMII